MSDFFLDPNAAPIMDADAHAKLRRNLQLALGRLPRRRRGVVEVELTPVKSDWADEMTRLDDDDEMEW